MTARTRGAVRNTVVMIIVAVLILSLAVEAGLALDKTGSNSTTTVVTSRSTIIGTDIMTVTTMATMFLQVTAANTNASISFENSSSYSFPLVMIDRPQAKLVRTHAH